jgi:hypothetical protein
MPTAQLAESQPSSQLVRREAPGGSGRVALTLDGQVKITNEQLQVLSKQVKDRLPLH